MTVAAPTSAAEETSNRDTRKSCGIVMPIGGMGDNYPEEHWRRVRKVIQRAIDRSGMKSQLVWENAEVDVIQSAILQNLYENDVVVCDVSGLNPNVMLETGLRLSTKKPTIIVTDRQVKPPFDISTVGYIEYQRDLEYNAIEDFIERLSEKLISVSTAYSNGTYQSFVEQFRFETVTPVTVNVSAEDHLREQLDFLASAIRRIEARDRDPKIRHGRSSPISRVVQVIGHVSQSKADEVETKLDALSGFGISTVTKMSENQHRFSIPVSDDSPYSMEQATLLVQDIVRLAEEEESPF